MPFEPRRVPPGTTVSYTATGGRQVDLVAESLEGDDGYAFITPADAAADEVLADLGFDRVARKAQAEQTPAETTSPTRRRAGGTE